MQHTVSSVDNTIYCAWSSRMHTVLSSRTNLSLIVKINKINMPFQVYCIENLTFENGREILKSKSTHCVNGFCPYNNIINTSSKKIEKMRAGIYYFKIDFKYTFWGNTLLDNKSSWEFHFNSSANTASLSAQQCFGCWWAPSVMWALCMLLHDSVCQLCCPDSNHRVMCAGLWLQSGHFWFHERESANTS